MSRPRERDFIVHKNGCVEFRRWGFYGPGCNSIEESVKRLQVLRVLIDHACDSLSETSEIQTSHGEEMLALADACFEQYKPLIDAGVDLTAFVDWWKPPVLAKMMSRPLCGHELGLLPGEESDPEFPGWEYRHPGFWYKPFQTYSVGADNWEGIRVFIYDSGTCPDEPRDIIEITCKADMDRLKLAVPEAYDELCPIIDRLVAEEAEQD